MKPIWHTGPWTEEDTENLIRELAWARLNRSLTAEERNWLETWLETHNV